MEALLGSLFCAREFGCAGRRGVCFMVIPDETTRANRNEAGNWNRLGDKHLAARNFREAAAHYEQALRLYPDFAEAHDNLGIALQHLKEWREAVNRHPQATGLDPSFAAA